MSRISMKDKGIRNKKLVMGIMAIAVAVIVAFVIYVMAQPTINSVDDAPDPVEVPGYNNITANISDATEAWVEIYYPDGTLLGNFSMNPIPINTYYTIWYYNRTYQYPDPLGTYSYTVNTYDGTGWSSSSGTFVVQDTTPPTSTVDPIVPYWTNNAPITITVTASDNYALANVSLWYRYSTDNATWGAWAFFAKDTDGSDGWSFSFDFPDGEGFYEFYSIANDTAGNTEAAPSTADAGAGYDTTPPPYTAPVFGEPNYTIQGFPAINCTTPMWINVTDDASGAAWLNFSIWWNPDQPGPFDLITEVSVMDNGVYDLDETVGRISVDINQFIGEECFHEIIWEMDDYLGNHNGPFDIDIAVDCSPPVIVKEIGEPKQPGIYGNATWVTNRTPIWFNISDVGCGGGAGVWKFGYEIWWKENCTNESEQWNTTRYEKVVIIDNEKGDLDPRVGYISNVTFLEYDCCHEIHYWAMDYVGNNMSTKQKHWVDNTPPAIRKDIEKIVALEQTLDGKFVSIRNLREGGSMWDDNQSFAAPWSYIDAVSVKLVGSGDVVFETNDTWVEIWDDEGNLLASSEVKQIDDEVDGWIQFHLTERLYVEHGATYWLTVKSYADLHWYYNESNPYAGGYAIVDGEVNYSCDFAFKIEYYPIYPYFYPMEYTEYSVGEEHDGLNGTWLTTQATLVLSTWDEWCMGGVGVKNLLYRIWFNDTWHPVDGKDMYCGNYNITYVDGKYWYVAINDTVEFTKIQFHEECKHILQIRAEDLLGNVRIINQTHYVDDSPPELHIEYPDVHGFYYDEETGKQFVRAGKTFWLNLTDEPECAVGWRDFTFYWRYEYWNYTTPEKEKHPANYSDDEYGEVVEINGELWWKIVPRTASVPLRFNRECLHSIYYFYEASDWLDNTINTSDNITKVDIYVDAYDPEVYKEHPVCYKDEPIIYLHPNNWPAEANPWTTPTLEEWIAYLNWTQFYPTDEFGREYEGTYYPKFDSYVDSNGNNIADDGDYIELVDTQYGVHRLYLIKNMTITLEIYNETLNKTKYVEFTGYYDGSWTSDFSILKSNPLGSLWHEVYPTFSNMYNLTWSSAPLDIGTKIMLNDTETNEWHNWTIENVTWDLIVDPVPFIQKCARINLTAVDTPEKLVVVDQAQTEGNELDTLQNYTTGVIWPWDAQTFMPNASYINATALYLKWIGDVDVTIYIHDASFAVIGSASKHLSGTGEDWVTFTFEPGIAVTPGETYYIEAHGNPPSNASWYFATEDKYTRGHAWISGEEKTDFDWKFQIMSYTDNPCASGIEGIYFGYYYNDVWHPANESDNVSKYGQVVDIRDYYDDEEIRTNFSGHYLWYVYDDSIGVHFREECIHWLYYWAKDNVCHHTPVYMQVYHVDEYNPVVYKKHPEHGYYTPVEIEVDRWHDDGSNKYEGFFKVIDEWTDWYGGGWMQQQAGNYIDKYTYARFTITNNDPNKAAILTFHIEEVEGDDGITLENGTNLDSITFTVEVSPQSTHYVYVYVYDNWEFLREGIWHWWVEIENVTYYLKAGVNITLTAEDPGECPSGIEAIFWRYVWNDTEYPQEGEYGAINGSQFAIYGYDENITGYWWYVVYDNETNISFDEECRHDLYYWAKDRACHNSTVHHQVYFVDASPPIIEETLPEHGAIGNATQSLFEDFEVPFTDWAVVGDWYRISDWWPYWDNMPRSGRYCAYGEDGWLISPRITVPQDGNLTFYYMGNGEFEVKVSTDPDQTETTAFVTQLWTSGTFTDSMYRRVEVDLSAYAGQEIYIGFHVISGEIYIDDVWIGGIHRIATPFEDDIEDSMAWDIEDLTVTGSYWTAVNRVPVYLDTPPAPAVNCYDGSLPNYNGFGQYGCNWNDTLTIANPIDLSSLDPSDTVWLNFTLWMDVSGDTLYVEASNDSSNWDILATFTADQSWEWESIDLSDYIGNDTVWIRFRFVSDDDAVPANGVFIDSVNVSNSTTPFFFDDFGTVGSPDMSNWVGEMLETSRWHIVDTDYHSYNHSWWCGDDSSSMYLNCMNDALISPAIDLTDATYTGKKAMLMFWHTYDMEEDADYGYVEISTDGTTWTTLATYTGSRDWVQEFVDISGYIGQTVYIRYRFYSDNSVKDGGWYVDDVKVEIREITETTFEDGFERSFPPAGWMEKSYGDYDAINDTDYQTWDRWSHPDSNLFRYSAALIMPWHGEQDEWLISPLIPNLPKFSNLTFYNEWYCNRGKGEVLISTTGTDPADFTVLRSWDASNYSESGTVDISLWDYAGKDVYIAFRFTTNYGDGFTGSGYYNEYWAVDNINITSLGFLREGAPIHLEVIDQPIDSECDAGVEAIFWRYETGGEEYPYPPQGDGYGTGYDEIVHGKELAERYGYTDENITDYWWYVVYDDEVDIIFNEECIHDLYYFAKDNVCHRTEIFHERWYVDGTAPYTELTVEWADHPEIPKNDYYDGYGRGSLPSVICINDYINLTAIHYGTEPCIYPYNWSNATYYRWVWYNESSGEYEYYPTAETPGAIWGGDINVSSYADEIDGYWWMKYTEPFNFTEGCEHWLYYFSKDDLCNTEEPNVWHVGVDDEAPVTDIEFEVSNGNVYYGPDNTIYFQNCTWFIINATDLPNNTECQTGIWYIDYTVWRWVSNEVEIQLLTNELPTLYYGATVYIEGEEAGYIYDWIDTNGDGNWSVSDYMYVYWTSPYDTMYDDGWYHVEDIDFTGVWTLKIRDVFGGAGYWEPIIPWTRAYSLYDSSPYDGIFYDGGYWDDYFAIWIHLGELVNGDPCGKYEIHWEVYDYNNMTIGEQKQDVCIDCTPPRTKKEFSEPVIEQEIAGGEVIHWVSPSTKIWLNGTDNFIWDSGVNETWYKFWEEDPILLWKYGADTFEQPYYPGVFTTSKHWFTVDEAAQIMGYDDIIDYFESNPSLDAGIVELFHWSVDNVSHVEDYQLSKQHLWVDAMPPISRVDDIVPYVREEVPFDITVVDIEDFGFEAVGPIGVCKVDVYYSYSSNNVTFGDWKLYATYEVPWDLRNDVPNWTFSFDAPEGPGWYRFKSIAYDCLANEEQPPFEHGTYDAECWVIPDTEPPVITKEYGQPCIEINLGEEIGHAITSDTLIWLNATDMPEEDDAGIDKIFWSFDGITWYETASYDGAHTASHSFTPAAFGLAEGTLYHIFFKATDMLGHITDEYKQKFIIDDTAPVTSISIEGNDTMPFNITVTASDNVVGVKKLTLYYRYSEDGVTWTSWMEYGSVEDVDSYTWQFIYAPHPTYYKPGYYEFYVYAEDYLGNAKSTTPTAEASCYVPPIPEDINGDGRVNVMDLYQIILHWEETGTPGWIPEDLNKDGVINADDIYMLILKWTG